MQPHIIRAALALLGWQQRELAAASGVSLRTVEHILAGQHGSRASVGQICGALKSAGIVFIDGAHLQGVALADRPMDDEHAPV